MKDPAKKAACPAGPHPLRQAAGGKSYSRVLEGWWCGCWFQDWSAWKNARVKQRALHTIDAVHTV